MTAARTVLLEYDWPGNVRELKHVVEALVVSSRDGEMIGESRTRDFLEKPQVRPGQTEILDELVDQHIRHTLDACGSNKAKAARRLGISRKTLYRRLGR